MKPGTRLVVSIADLAFGGDGLARHEGAVIFVPFTAVGDEVEVEIIKSGKSFYRAMPVDFTKEGPGREEPRCPYFGACGGCQYQHLAYATELAAKEKQLGDLLERVGGLVGPHVEPILASPQPYGYRNRITVHQEEGRLGFRATDGRTLIDVKSCLIASEAVNRRLAKLRSMAHPREHYSVREPGLEMEVFYQTNRFMPETFVNVVLGTLQEGIGGVVEGYCGHGFFTHPLAKRVKVVVGIESNERSAELARKGAPPNCAILSGEVETLLPEALESLGEHQKAVLLDPPREGLSHRVKDHLLSLASEQLIYVSCNPSTLARDLRDLASVWEPVSFQPVDLFPRTAHFEIVAAFRRRR